MANNLDGEAAELLRSSAIAKGSYCNHFHAVLAAAPVLPRWRPAPTAPFMLTARVVGLADEALTTERDPSREAASASSVAEPSTPAWTAVATTNGWPTTPTDSCAPA